MFEDLYSQTREICLVLGKNTIFLTAEHQRPLKGILRGTRDIIKIIHEEKENNK